MYGLLISRAGRDNWIGEAIVAQAFHKAIHHIHHRGLLVSLRITCVYSINAICLKYCYTGSTVILTFQVIEVTQLFIQSLCWVLSML